MFALRLPFVLLSLAATPEAVPAVEETVTPAQMRKAVERSLDFVEKGGVAWVSKSCVGCHHGPEMIWSHHEAEKRGFTINQKSLDMIRGRAIKDYTGHPDFKPTGMDGGHDLSVNTIYISLALSAASTIDDETAQALDKFATYLVKKQSEDGHWQVNANGAAKGPPLVDQNDAITMWALLVVTARDHPGIAKEVLEKSREKALKWLQDNKPSDTLQSLVLRILVRKRFGTAEEVQTLVKELIGQQNADGGWAQAKDKPSDALGTGQALYALSEAGVGAQESAVQRACGYLVKKQKDDGSWYVVTRQEGGNTSRFSTYMGSAWATIGLVRSLPEVGARP
jgi:prenyltransferase beta subunit